MSKSVLLTGATGFIGGSVARTLLSKKYNLTVIVRPGRLKKYRNSVTNLSSTLTIAEIDLSQTKTLKEYLSDKKFDIILHIGALRGGKKFSQKAYYDTNVKATEQIALNALNNNSQLLFCSSVGVYGAIPLELPATINTVFQQDNYYHQTKIEAENILQNLILRGLKVTIIRPSITYGEGDYGFPYTLTKLVHHKMLFLPQKDIRIHLTNIDNITEAFYKLTEKDDIPNKIYNIADRHPIILRELVDTISQKLTGKDYPRNRFINVKHFRNMETIALKLRLHNLVNRIRLISYDWYYDCGEIYNDLFLRHAKTNSDFKSVIDWYKKVHKIK